ncbi:hypothetical protein MASR1M8_16240 [Thermomonas brevis]
MRMTFDGNGDLERLRAAKTPGWRHGTKKRPNAEKRIKAKKIRGARRGEKKAAMRAYARLRVAAGCWKPT